MIERPRRSKSFVVYGIVGDAPDPVAPVTAVRASALVYGSPVPMQPPVFPVPSVPNASVYSPSSAKLVIFTIAMPI